MRTPDTCAPIDLCSASFQIFTLEQSKEGPKLNSHSRLQIVSSQPPKQNQISLLRSALGWMQRAKTLETTPRRIEFRIPAAFLFHQVIFGAAGVLRCGKNVFPIAGPFAEKNLVAV